MERTHFQHSTVSTEKKSACKWSSNPHGSRVHCVINGLDEGKVFTEVLFLSAIRCPSLLPCSLSLLTATRLNILEVWLTNNRKCVTSGCLCPSTLLATSIHHLALLLLSVSAVRGSWQHSGLLVYPLSSAPLDFRSVPTLCPRYCCSYRCCE